MSDSLPQLALVAVLIILNAGFSGSEIALLSLREGQLKRMEEQSETGRRPGRRRRHGRRLRPARQRPPGGHGRD